MRSPELLDDALAWLRAKNPERGETIIRNANRFVRGMLAGGRLGADEPCPMYDPAGDPNGWKWVEERDGEKVYAQNIRRILRCLMDAKMARAVIDYAADGLQKFMRAGEGEACQSARCKKSATIRRAALKAAREMTLGDAERLVEAKYAMNGPIEGLG